MKHPLVTKETAMQFEAILSSHFQAEDKDLVGTLERLIRAGQVARYESSIVSSARDEARGLRAILAAAIATNPAREIRISAVAQHSMMGPGRIAIMEWRDMPTGDVVYRLQETAQNDPKTS